MPPDHGALERCLRDVAVAAADVALYCDRVEHAEPASPELIAAAGAALRDAAARCAAALGVDLLAAYGQRLAVVERRGTTNLVATFDGPAAAHAARTWADLQAVQARHDREYHLDVVGLARGDQVRHCALHAAKLAGSLARALDGSQAAIDELAVTRCPDLLVFGLKLADLAREALPALALPRTGARPQLPAVRRIA